MPKHPLEKISKALRKSVAPVEEEEFLKLFLCLNQTTQEKKFGGTHGNIPPTRPLHRALLLSPRPFQNDTVG